MATVFLATDLKHQRSVALKMMREPISGVIGAERFLREIAVTAQLDHPHVVPLLDSGATDGELFYVMPFVEGETLRARLERETQLPIEVALSVARDVLDALAYAHARGVIHRDIKPENILLSGSHARVADFGVARAVAESGGDTLTGTGIALGTPTYMSPEQGAGDRNLDQRSDLYAVGCVMYEMLAGQPPFSGRTSESIVRQHLVAQHPPVSQLRPTVPSGLAAVIDRALAKAPADRFESAAAFSAALEMAARAAPTMPSAVSDARQPVVPSPRRRAIALLVGTLVLATIVVGIRWTRRPTAPVERPLVAVLAFENRGSPDDDYFADGVTTEITTKLARISGIGVIARQTAMRYRGSSLSLREIARELGVQYVLSGGVHTERLSDGTGRVRVTPELVRADDERTMWTDALTVPLSVGEVFDVQARIAESVANAFNVTILKPEIDAVRRRETESLEAYQAYQLGRFLLAKAAPGPVREAIGYLEQAVALDPKYARAHAELVGAYLLIPSFPMSWMPQQEIFRKAEAAARSALALDPGLAAAHSALGEVMAQTSWRWAEAESAQRTAIGIDPDAVEFHLRLAGVLGVMGKGSEALREAERALELEPTSAPARRVLAWYLFEAGRADEARTLLLEALRLEPAFMIARVSLAEFAAASGDLSGMGDHLAKVIGLDTIGTAIKQWAEGRAPKSDAVRAIEAMRSANPELDLVRKAWLFANVGEISLALDALEEAITRRAPTSAFLLQFPSVQRALGHQPRFRSLVAVTGVQVAAAR